MGRHNKRTIRLLNMQKKIAKRREEAAATKEVINDNDNGKHILK